MDAPPDEVLELIVRFTASIGDVTLTIDAPRRTTGLSLKQLIRKQLPVAYTSRRLRLIYAGKVLPDTESLSASLNLSFHKSNRDLNQNGAKGKQPVRGSTSPPPIKLYIHCSIGDALSEKELADESTAAKAAEQGLLTPAQSASIPIDNARSTDDGERDTSTSSAPRGFDRLLTTGFTATEVAALRTQFLAILSHTHTPDDMPTGTALLALEDRWLDNDTNNGGGSNGIGEADGEAWGVDDGRTLDDFLWGNVFGFFWPLGAIVWGFREEGVWTRRRQIAVFTGILINLVFGFARLTS
ncbi:hypothetical protein NA57DRAFT_41979 [Rhizodiscina lignyota]|uniref:Ubiquitin-like domain-containing protein n=1 Tax=Rhizodiscina lignyota TaxID=1504668 RepID=A0A9P4M3H2_9PEZI|nr:hypothetical protein NA57DRAFT_41979 [Rhizodiscina lignyota]